MLQVTQEKKEKQDIQTWMMNQCNELLRQWQFELSLEEKEIWLWNALVAMKKIEKRRKS